MPVVPARCARGRAFLWLPYVLACRLLMSWPGRARWELVMSPGRFWEPGHANIRRLRKMTHTHSTSTQLSRLLGWLIAITSAATAIVLLALSVLLRWQFWLSSALTVCVLGVGFVAFLYLYFANDVREKAIRASEPDVLVTFPAIAPPRLFAVADPDSPSLQQKMGGLGPTSAPATLVVRRSAIELWVGRHVVSRLWSIPWNQIDSVRSARVTYDSFNLPSQALIVSMSIPGQSREVAIPLRGGLFGDYPVRAKSANAVAGRVDELRAALSGRQGG